jgi:hypothetical protein
VNPFVVRGSASVITVVIGSVKCRQPSALFELVEAATRKDSCQRHAKTDPLTASEI